MFFCNSLAFYDPTDVCNLISGSCAFSTSTLYIWKFLVHVLLKPSLENFEHYFASMWNKCNCTAMGTQRYYLSLGLEWKLTFSSPVATAEFSKFVAILSAALSQHHRMELPFQFIAGIPSSPLVGFRKGRGTKDQIANIHCFMKKARGFQKNIYFCFINYTNPLTMWRRT